MARKAAQAEMQKVVAVGGTTAVRTGVTAPALEAARFAIKGRLKRAVEELPMYSYMPGSIRGMLDDLEALDRLITESASN